MTSSPVPTLNNISSAYEFDDLELNEKIGESWASWLDINDVIFPDQTWRTTAPDFGDDSFYAELRAIAPDVGQVYKDFGKPGSKLRKYNAGFFWLRLPKPNRDEVSRLYEPPRIFRSPYRLPQQVRQALHGRHTDDALLISCISIGDAAGHPKSVVFPGSAVHQERTALIRDLLFRVLLASAGAHTRFLSSIQESEVYRDHQKILDPTETQMPLPNTTLPSKRTRSNQYRIPRFFDVAWPNESPVIQCRGFAGFFHDFYHMTVRRPYQNAPNFNFIRVLINPEGDTSKLSLPNCLIVCSSSSVQEILFQALLSVRVKQGTRDWSPPLSWNPLHELMNCISIIYQVMFQQTQLFIEDRLLLLQKMKFHGRVHPHRSKFQYLLHLEDQVEKSQTALVSAKQGLETWINAEIHGVKLASVPGAGWPARVERLLTDASHLISSLEKLGDRRYKLHSMLKEQLDLNSGTRSLVLTILASIYIPLAFVSSYFGMNATQITNGGLISTTTFWKVSIPLVVASIIIPVAFSGLLIRVAVKVIRSSYRKWLRWKTFFVTGILIAFNIASAVMGGRPLFWIVWTLNLLYTMEFLMWVPDAYRDLFFASKILKDAIAARRSYMPGDSNTARASSYSAGSCAARHPNTSRGSGETQSSWVTANSDLIEGSNVSNGSSSLSVEAREKAILRKQLSKGVFEAFASYTQIVVIIGCLGLGAAFLTLDILNPKAKRLSIYHSFALWMSLVSVLRVTVWKTLQYIWRRAQINWERVRAKSVRSRRRRGSGASQSERNSSIASDGAV